MQLSENMQGLFAILFLCFVTSPCLCARTLTTQANPTFNILNFGAKGNGQDDDSQAFLKAWGAVCNATQGIPTLFIPKGKTFMLQPLVFQGPCKPSTINFKIEGTITAPRSVNAWKWPDSHRDSWIQFSYINGLSITGRSLIDGQGAPWWDCFAKSRCERPMALSFHSCENLQLSGVTQINSPGGHVKVYASNGTRISDMHLVSPKDSPNTDGLHISASSNVAVENSTTEVGDDCIAILGGTSFVNISGIYCGPGHGISIGSLGGNGVHATVEEIHVKNCTFTRSSSGARIKTREGGSGYVRKITYEDIVLVEVQSPILIVQNYGSLLPIDAGQAVKVSDITYRNFRGTASFDSAIQLICDKVIGCSNVVLDQIQITSSVPGKKTNATCLNAHGTSSSSNVPQIPCLLK
ncbi:putative polygalacturonase [Senna tora]|uniref:Putative polygalacturonase n=1 Tax=Senna tora TaxID=362788 RepID=A0A834X309_9FABA|nr:putative polygalacturonase [Senna tora]